MHRINLSSAAQAAALVAIGFPRDGLRVDPLQNNSTGEKRLGWIYQGAQALDVSELINRAKAPVAHPKALWREDPVHPFLAALAGAWCYEALMRWREAPQTIPYGALCPGKKLLVLQWEEPATGDFLRVAQQPAFFQTWELPLAAALIACGFVPRPELGAGGAVRMPERSVFWQELDAAAAVGACSALTRPVAAPEPLPGFPPGRHPLHYAFAAAGNLATAPQVMAEAWKKPTHFFKGVKSAIANDAALDRPGFEQKLERHLAGLAVE